MGTESREISSPSLTTHDKLGLLTQGRGEGQRTEADERTRTADLVSLRVIHHVLQGCAEACKSRISKPVSFLRLALCCTVLRSRWCQSGVRRTGDRLLGAALTRWVDIAISVL